MPNVLNKVKVKKVLESFQQIGARHLASQFHAALGDQRGLGKTPQAIAAAEMVNAKTALVTCPASVRTSWWEHVEEHFGHTRGWDIRSYNFTTSQANVSTLRDKYDVWIGDELHFCKTLESQRTQAIFGAEGLARRATYKWPLSGTFAPNHRPVELYPMLKALCAPFRAMSYAAYTQQYCGAFFDGRGMNVKGASRIDELREMMRGFLLRRTKAEVYPDRKAPLISTVPVELSRADLEAVHAAEDAIGAREARISSRFEDFSQLGDSSMLLRLLGNAMVPHVVKFVDDLLETTEKVVVFAHHVDVMHRLEAHFRGKGLRPVVYRGGMSDAQKSDAVRIFQAPECRVFVGQRQAAGTGINGLQRVCSTAVIAEPSWTPGETDQLIGRLDRIGQQDELVNAYVLYARSTLSAVVVQIHDRKERVGERLERPRTQEVWELL